MITRIIKFCLLALVFTPFVVDNNTFFPYITGKNLFIQSLIVVATILFVINFFTSFDFRRDILYRVKVLTKNRLFLLICSFFILFFISAIFAIDKQSAFWGNLERGGGLSGFSFSFFFFVVSLLMFRANDWLFFLRLNIVVGLLLVTREFFDFFYLGNLRPISFFGNPTFLAGYLLSSISSSLILLNFTNIVSKFWKYISLLTIFLSAFGIFLTQTRGTILALFLATFCLLILIILKKKNIYYRSINLRKVLIGFVCLIVIFSGVFFITKNNHVWQKIPGLSRLASTNLNSTNSDTLSRLFIYESAIKSVNPISNGWSKLLIGWGPENFIFADSKNYNPEHYKYEINWYDRSHNKLLDVLVMNGLIALLVYIFMWLTFFRINLSSKNTSLLNIGLFFFGISFLTHMMFIFEDISIGIICFAMFAMTIRFNDIGLIDNEKHLDGDNFYFKKVYLFFALFALTAIFLMLAYFKETLPAYIQVNKYFSLIGSQDIGKIQYGVDPLLESNTIASFYINRDFLIAASENYQKNKDVLGQKILEKALISSEDYLRMRPVDFLFMAYLANVYTETGRILNNKEYIKRGELLFRKVLDFAPNRPDIIEHLALNLFSQRNFSESFILFEKSFDLSQSYFDLDKVGIEKFYGQFIYYFYLKKDKDNFVKAANRLKIINYSGSMLLDKVIDYLNKNQRWPEIDFNYTKNTNYNKQ